MVKYFVVWNEDKTEGFVTKHKHLAYEVRKSSDSNCYTEEGGPAPVAKAFCDKWGWGNCTMEEFDKFD